MLNTLLAVTDTTEVVERVQSTVTQPGLWDMLSAYWNSMSGFDYIIIGLGFFLLAVQLALAVPYIFGYQVFLQYGEKTMELCRSLCEFFPLLGLLGTVMGLLGTFSYLGAALGTGEAFSTTIMKETLSRFAPALTTTVSGILMIIANLFVHIVIDQVFHFVQKED